MEKREFRDTNKVRLIGQLVSKFEFDHETHNNKMYSTVLKVKRTSGEVDNVPLVIDEDYLDSLPSTIYDEKVYVEGFIVTARTESGRLLVNVRANKVELRSNDDNDMNLVEISGVIGNWPKVRQTPFGRKIADMNMLARRAYGKVSFIPTIVWGNQAELVSKFCKYTPVFIRGRFQSRRYTKTYDDGTTEERETYEISISKVVEN